jgi:hypothetical protein
LIPAQNRKVPGVSRAQVVKSLPASLGPDQVKLGRMGELVIAY